MNRMRKARPYFNGLSRKENTQAALIEALKANLYGQGENHNEF